jgi:hypothetical protein
MPVHSRLTLLDVCFKFSGGGDPLKFPRNLNPSRYLQLNESVRVSQKNSLKVYHDSISRLCLQNHLVAITYVHVCSLLCDTRTAADIAITLRKATHTGLLYVPPHKKKNQIDQVESWSDNIIASIQLQLPIHKQPTNGTTSKYKQALYQSSWRKSSLHRKHPSSTGQECNQKNTAHFSSGTWVRLGPRRLVKVKDSKIEVRIYYMAFFITQ